MPSPELRDPGLTLGVRPARVARALAIVMAVLVVVGLIANRLVYSVAPDIEAPLARAAARFDLGLEPSVPALFSTFLLAACAVMLAVNGRATPRGAPGRGGWWLLAIVFVALAIDETVMIHEMADDTLHRVLGTSGVLYFAWVIPGALFTLAVALASLRLLIALDARTRALFLLAGVVFVGGAIGMELIAGVVVEASGPESVGHMIEQGIEETMEMSGSILFLYALLDRFGRAVGSARIDVAPGSGGESR